MLRVFGRSVFAVTLVLGIAEAVIVGAIIYAGAAIFSGDVVDLPPTLGLGAATIATAVVLVMHSVGLYNRAVLANLRQSLIKLAFVIGPIFMLAVITTGMLAKNDVVPIYPYRWQWTFALTTVWFASIFGVRMFFAYLHDNGTIIKRVAVLGGGDLLGQLRELVNAHHDSIRIAAHLDQSKIGLTGASRDLALLRAVEAANAQEIIVDDTILSRVPITELVRCRSAGFGVIRFPDLFERETGRVDLESVEPGALLFSRGLKQGPMFDFFKRSVDIAMALFGLILFLPVMAAAALAIRLEGSGPIFYRQERVGRNCKPFMILKFRSMRVDAEKNGTPRWACERDPRVTLIGQIIRKVRIDELPQFWNVLRGDMSTIGPRPERPYFVSELSARLPFYQERHLVRPGITGWAQVNFRYGASLEDAAQKHSYDLYYLKYRCIVLDLLIIMKTVQIVVFAQGSR